MLDLYQGRWKGKLLHPGDFVICADEKPSNQARNRIHPVLGPEPGSRGQRVEHTYERKGALTYLAALDIGRRGGRAPRVFGRSEPKGGIAPFDRLVHQVMRKEPYASARNVFWIVDNGSSHRGQRSIDRLQGRWKNLTLVHPAHPCQLAQPDRDLNEFERHWNEIAEPFEWNFTRDKLAELMQRLAAREPELRLAA